MMWLTIMPEGSGPRKKSYKGREGIQSERNGLIRSFLLGRLIISTFDCTHY